jgi:hypothetical protein
MVQALLDLAGAIADVGTLTTDAACGVICVSGNARRTH